MKLSGVEFPTEGDIIVIQGAIEWLKKKFHRVKNKKGVVGIVIAISTENNKERLRVETDLIKGLNDLLKQSIFASSFNVLKLTNEESEKISDKAAAEKILKKIGGHMMVYGRIYERIFQGKNTYFIKLWCLVRHRSIPIIVSNYLSQDFTSVFPNDQSFSGENEFLGFEITKDWLWLVAKYVVGFAAYISLDFDLAFRLYTDLQSNMQKQKISTPGIEEIKKRLPARLVELSRSKCAELYNAFVKSRDINYIKEAKLFLDLLKKHIPNDYGAALSRAMYIFLIEKNVKSAIKELIRIKNPLDETWRYSLAFLYAYSGDLGKSMRIYDKAAKGSIHGKSVLNEIEMFISDILDKNPKYYQLYFARGYFDFKARGDMKLAKEDFALFMKKVPTKLYLNEQRLAKIYIEQIK